MNNQVEIKANKHINDSLFRILFHEKKNALSLYNAINGTDYTDEENITITTVQDALYVSYKNDLSFVFHDILSLYEQQTTVNPNMPLRGLIYFTEVYKAFLGSENEIRERLYSEKLIMLPLPRYYVFYNGKAERPESWELRLSTAYNDIGSSVEGDIEVVAHMVNVNHGKNTELMERCKVLNDYSEVVTRVRGNKKSGMSNEDAVSVAIDECIAEGILEEFLRRERSRVKNVLLYGMTEEEIRETQQNILNKAVADSRDEILAMNNYLIAQARYEDLARASIDKDFCQVILDEMHADRNFSASSGRSDWMNDLPYGITEEDIRETQQKSILEKAVADGVKKGHDAGVAEKCVKDVDNLMLKLGLTLKDACDITEISVDDYYIYKNKMAGIDFVSE